MVGDGIDNDCDGNVDEEQRDRIDNDGDGLVDEDLAEVLYHESNGTKRNEQT